MKIETLKLKYLEQYASLVNKLNAENNEIKNKKNINTHDIVFDKKAYTQKLEEISNSPYHFCFVGIEKGSVVATAAISICPDFSGVLKPFAVLENFIVDEKFRNKGYGRQLIEYVEIFSKEKGCGVILFTSSLHRQAAHNFYKKQGYLKYPVRGYKKCL